MPELASLTVPIEVRDRLARAAAARGLTVGALLDDFSRRALDDVLMEQVEDEMSALSQADPQAWSAYVDEGRAWEEGTIEPLGP